MYKTSRFHLSLRVYFDNARRTSKRGKTSGLATCLRFGAYVLLGCSYLQVLRDCHPCVIRVIYLLSYSNSRTVALLLTNILRFKSKYLNTQICHCVRGLAFEINEILAELR